MSDIMYDIQKLMELDEFDEGSVNKYMSIQAEYCKRLNNFLDNYPRYLASFNPTVVIYGEDVQHDFLEELKNLKSEFVSLGIKMSATEVAILEEAVHAKSQKGLSDGLIKFHAKMDIIASHIKNSFVSEGSNISTSEVFAKDKPVIIAVDDSLLILNIIKDMLENDYTVIAMTSGEEALLAAEQKRPDLFLLDIEMPNMNGHELVDRIKAISNLKDIPILFLTSSASRKHVFTAKEQGVKDYILKPVDKNILLSKIKKTIELS